MFTRPAQHLTIQSPSSTTISYTVSNASSNVARSSRILSYLQGTLRVLICIFVLLVDVATAEIKFAPRPWDTFVTFGFIENAARTIPRVLDWRVITVLSFAILYLCIRRSYTGATHGLYRGHAVVY
jgi:hypothetical protein